MTNILKKEDFASNLPIFQGTFTNLAFQTYCFQTDILIHICLAYIHDNVIWFLQQKNLNAFKMIKLFNDRICAQTQDLQIFKKFNMSQMNPKVVFHLTLHTQFNYLT